MITRGVTLLLGIAAALLLGASPVALAQTPPGSGPPQVLPAASAPAHGPLPWSSLDAAQQRMLAPVAGEWAKMHPWRQHRLARHAAHWSTLPAERQQEIQARLAHWATMTPEQRRQLRDNARAFHDLTPAQQARVSDAFNRFQSLSPAERHALWERWRAASRERHQHRAGDHANPPAPASAQSSGPTH